MLISKMNKSFFIAAIFSLSLLANAEETNLEKAETVKNHAVDNVKEGYRGAKDKGCKMINGKMDCAVKKFKNKVKNQSDKVKTDAKELQNKVD
jgi:hypothetical protein